MNRTHFGDCRATMRELAAQGVRVQTCVTSPPYWGLRDYGVEWQIGLEATVDEWVAVMVEVFRCVRDLLRDDGTLWLNLGDSYAGSCGAQSREHAGKHASNVSALSSNQVIAAQRRKSGTGSIPVGSGLKPKDLIGQPWLLAFALRADGWYLRQDIIWAKPNPMPESVRDRCTKAHEYLFLMSKSERYYFDAKAISEPVNGGAHARLPGNGYKTPDGWDTRTGQGGHGSFHAEGREKGAVKPPQGVGRREGPPGNPAEGARMGRGAGWRERKLAETGSGTKNNGSFDEAMAVMPERRNKRSVWTVASEPYSGAHFATFPTALIEPCILAGSRPGDVVLDPFMGSGTTAQVAQRLGRKWIGCELNREYESLQKERTAQSAFAL
jgi:site-specific DNA-methyltransferase (cytosine-N4-specific)